MAAFITQAKFDEIPTPAVNLAKLCILDAAGCAIYGTTRPLGKILASLVDELGGKPVARLLGMNIDTNAVNAAMVNGALIHSEDFDDLIGHHASILTPVVFALGEEYRLGGKQVLLSYILGFDISSAVMHAVGEDHYGRGWHSPSSIGTLGSTAAAAKMLGLEEMQARMALGIGATQCSGLRANFGTMTKPFHPANASRAAVMAAKMAQKGYEANPDVMEDRFGYAAVYGDQMMQLSAVTRHLGNPWALMGSGKEIANGAPIKAWPCCGATHGVITLITGILKKHPIKPEDIASVDIQTSHNPSTVAANVRWPKTGLEGKFSPSYTVASCIIDGGRLDLASFTDEAASRPAVQELLKIVNVTQDRDYVGRPQRATGGGHFWELTATLKSGERLTTPRMEAAGARGNVYGWETREAVFAKFKELAGTVLKPSQADAALNAIMELDKATDMRKIVDTLVPMRG